MFEMWREDRMYSQVDIQIGTSKTAPRRMYHVFTNVDICCTMRKTYTLQ